MKKIITMLLLMGSTVFAIGSIGTYPIWHGFQLVKDDMVVSTSPIPTDSFRASELLGIGTLWIEAPDSYTGTVTCNIEVYNAKTKSWANVGSVSFTNLVQGGNAVSFGDSWAAADLARIQIQVSSGTDTFDVYIGVE